MDFLLYNISVLLLLVEHTAEVCNIGEKCGTPCICILHGLVLAYNLVTQNGRSERETTGSLTALESFLLPLPPLPLHSPTKFFRSCCSAWNFTYTAARNAFKVRFQCAPKITFGALGPMKSARRNSYAAL